MGLCVTNWYFSSWSNTVSDSHTHIKVKQDSFEAAANIELNAIFYVGPQCSAQCGPGVEKREVVCLTRGGVNDGGGGGDCVGEKPAELKACNGGPCVQATMWYSSPWTQVGQRTSDTE